MDETVTIAEITARLRDDERLLGGAELWAEDASGRAAAA